MEKSQDTPLFRNWFAVLLIYRNYSENYFIMKIYPRIFIYA